MAQEEEPRKIKYPDDQSSYEILDEIGKGLSSIVYKAVCRPMNSSIVAIKAINLDKCRVDMRNIIQETRLSHPNILQTHSYFLIGRLWVVMPFMSAGSLESIISHSFPNGLSESCIARVLKEILKALVYLHDQGHLHRNIKASNILIDSDGSVKLADFGVSSSIYESNSSQAPSSLPFSSSLTPFWMAPEEIHSHTGYSFESDIWSFGITALELAHGGPPLFHFPLLKSLINWITHRFRSFEYEKNRKDKKNFSGSFKDMVKSCLIADPSKRPSAKKLLTHPFFWNCKNADFLVKNMLQELPTIEERFTITKQIAPPPTSRDEKGSPAVKHNRRISGWNFNEMDLVFEPVFTTEKEESSSKAQEEESIIKRVRFGKEVITYESSDKDDENPSRPIPAEYTEVSREAEQSPISQRSNEESKMEETGSQIKIDEPKFGGHDDAGLQISATLQVALGMIPNLEVLLRSLSSQQELVSNMLFKIGGEVEKQLLLKIQQLRLELDQERNKCSALEMQLESIRRSNAAGVSHSNSDATGCNGHGSSSK